MYEIEIIQLKQQSLYANDRIDKTLQVYYDGIKIERPNYDIGKFFFFICIGNGKAIKFIHYTKSISKPIPEIEKIIKIQKLFSWDGLAFDCEEEIINILIKYKYRTSGKSKKYYGYITDAYPDPWVINTKNYLTEQYNNMKIIQSIHRTCLNNNIWRPHLMRELTKRKNYVINNEGARFIDIDPKFYFTACNQHIKDEIISKGQFPYRKRKYPYQSIEQSGILGIRNMAHRFEVLQFGRRKFTGKTVLDIGSGMGGFCRLAKDRGAKFCTGIDAKKEVIDIANKYFEAEGYNDIKMLVYDINGGLDRLQLLIGKQQYDYVFVLCMLKHVDNNSLFEIINYYMRERCWVEGHANQSKEHIQHLLEDNLKCKEINFLGYTLDRGKRPSFEGIK
jgi:2-polyprenyl-3-methyl-5-hydroxy-6-metoxy-1,4-benzoquinol methylase